MIRIAALNDSGDSSESVEETTNEALESLALQEYLKALDLQRKGKQSEALKLLEELLDTELLDQVKKPEPGGKVTDPLFNLKYLCFKNIASINSQLGDKERAIDAYWEASLLDDTDVTLWYKLGLLSLQCDRFEFALDAFQRGGECNSKHWPCIDKIITLLFGLNHYNECITTIYDAFELDPDYLRGKAYRKYIYSNYPYILDYLSYLNPIYSWKPEDDDDICEEEAQKLVDEGELISQKYIQQVEDNTFVPVNPELKLVKAIKGLTWLQVGESLVDMHNYMTENAYSHACIIEISYEKEVAKDVTIQDVEMKSDSESKEDEMTDVEKPPENCLSENENNEQSDKNATDNEKMESDPDNNVQNPEVSKPKDTSSNDKDAKKAPSRRRGNALSLLEQWEWCTKRRSSRKKTNTKQEQIDNSIFGVLKRLLPSTFIPYGSRRDDSKDSSVREHSPDTMDIYHLFEEKEKSKIENLNSDSNPEGQVESQYFGFAQEAKDVEDYISRFTKVKSDIIAMLLEFLSILSKKWNELWPRNLANIYLKASKCADNHLDPPASFDGDFDELRTYAEIHCCAVEIELNEKIRGKSKDIDSKVFEVIEVLGLCVCKPQIFQDDCFVGTLRYLWVKSHAYLIVDQPEFALDSLYQLLFEFDALGDEYKDTFYITITNFTRKNVLGKAEVVEILSSLERNKQLSRVMQLYDQGNFEEVLSILLESFNSCQKLASQKDYDAMSLDWTMQLCLILDVLWALEKTEECFCWGLTCLQESWKHYLLQKVGSQEFETWSLTVLKALLCIQHILNEKGTSYLDNLSVDKINTLVHNLVQIIGHQFEENDASDLPIGTVAPWIILHHILQREEDQGRTIAKPTSDSTLENNDGADLPNSIMILFTAHEFLSQRCWCCSDNGNLLHFTLDKLLPRLHTPAMSSSLTFLSQNLEQTVFCLYGYPSKKTRLRYLVDHEVPPMKLDWPRAKEIYVLYKPIEIPEVDAPKTASITADTEQILQKIVSLIPKDFDPKPYMEDVMAFINGKKKHLPLAKNLLPFQMRDIYYLLADFYFKNKECSKSLRYNLYDIIINKNRFDSWASVSLTKQSILDTKLNSGDSFKNDMDFLYKAEAVERCFKKAMEIDSTHSTVWIEYGTFIYGIHAFCSRLLKQSSESFSMEDFGELEQRKQKLLETSENCFVSANRECDQSEDKDDKWLHFYMLGKISEKKGNPPDQYLDLYMKAAKCLEDSKATYPTKINYNSPQHLSIEALEIYYRIHASILKYIVLHENKPIPISEGIVFKKYLERCNIGPFSNKIKKDNTENNVLIDKRDEVNQNCPSNILKRSISEAGDDQIQQNKKQKVEDCAKVKRSASYDNNTCNLNSEKIDTTNVSKENFKSDKPSEYTEVTDSVIEDKEKNFSIKSQNPSVLSVAIASDTKLDETSIKHCDVVKEKQAKDNTDNKENDKVTNNKKHKNTRRPSKESTTTTNTTSADDGSSESCSDSSSDTSSSNTSDTASTKISNDDKVSSKKPMTHTEIDEIIVACLGCLEDCVSRLPQHYKALYRLAHYHFYYKRGKDIERCRDLMLGTFTSRNGHKLQGLFCERKNTNFFNGIWRIPVADVDRPGSFATHMSRCILLTMTILKEIDDHKSLLDLSLQLQKVPDPDKKYLRDSEREDSEQQAMSFCVQCLKGQLTKFSQQADIKSNEVEKKALSSLMMDIYRTHQKALKHSASVKPFLNLLIEGYKLSSAVPITDTANLADASLKYCQTISNNLKQQAIQNNMNPSANQVTVNKNLPSKTSQSYTKSTSSNMVNQAVKKSAPKEVSKAVTIPASTFLPNSGSLPPKMPVTSSAAALQNLSSKYMSYEYLSMFSDHSLFSHQSLMGNYTAYENELYLQILKNPNLAANYLPPNYPLPSKTKPVDNKTTKLPTHGASSSSNPVSTAVIQPAHMSVTSTTSAALTTKPPPPHQQVSPGKTLQEKLAEKQKPLKSTTDAPIIVGTATQSSSSKDNAPNVVKDATKKASHAKKIIKFGKVKEKLAKPKKPIDSSVIIEIDDDDD